MTVSILIVNWNTEALLARCLSSIHKYCGEFTTEVVVVDNASSDGSVQMVQRDFPWVNLLPEEQNLGYAEGNNVAHAASTGDFVLLLNPDTEFFDNSLQIALDRLRSRPELGCIAARLLDPEGESVDARIQLSVRGFPTFWGIIGWLTRLERLFPTSPLGSYRLPEFDYNKEQLAPQPMGTFLLFRQEALASVTQSEPLLSREFPIFFNEVDLQYRLMQKGWNTLFCPNVQVIHWGGASTKQVKKSMIWESHRSLIRYLKKHSPEWQAPFLWVLSGFILLAAFVRARGYSHGF